LDILERLSAVGAAYDSSGGRGRALCASGTRSSQLKILKDWVLDTSSNKKLFWLSGGVGAGKSSIAQTIAKFCAERGCLAATFFFKAGDETRSKVSRLIPTLSSQLAASSEISWRAIDEYLKRYPRALDEKNLQEQFQWLVQYPIWSLTPNKCTLKTPKLIVIDVVDESNDFDELRDFLSSVVSSLAEHKCHPLRILITSRPEQPIDAFFAGLSKDSYANIDLVHDDESDNDIRLYLTDKLAHVRSKHYRDYRESLQDWPHKSDIDWLVDRSTGHFIYASTVVKFIDNDMENPALQLDYILRRLNTEVSSESSPYEEIDKLYTTVLT
ncbi:hypothetical protein BDQ17DRAFT_1216141, partial [Cyathus striatus]